jgi:thymidylate kinase
LNGVVYATPPEKYRDMRKKIDTTASIEKHYEFYRDAVIEASIEIADILHSGKTVVCDRYWLSTIVYHRAGGLNLDESVFSKLIQPELTVLLQVSPEIQVQRSTKRGVNACDGQISGKQIELTNLFWNALLVSKLPFIAINTDNFSIDQCTNIVLGALSKNNK